MWDDIGTAIHGDGPTLTVLDPGDNHNHILDEALGGKVTIDWTFVGLFVPLLHAVEFHVDLWADPVGADPKVKIDGPGSTLVAGLGTFGPQNYQAVFPIAPNSLHVDAYRLTGLIRTFVGGLPIQMGGFVDGPVIQIIN
jgi:hypothetical protein